MENKESCIDYKIVYGVETYAKLHHLSELEAFALFRKYNLTDVWRNHAFTTLAQDEDELVAYAEDYLTARQAA
jgi:hypothetical protein